MTMQQHRSAQAKLAETLIESLGFDGAIHACQANGWDGVLAVLLGQGRRNGSTIPSRGRPHHA